VVDDSDPVVESDLRRRAAWLLLMLAIVAVLLVVVISALVKTNSSSGDGGNGSGPLDNIATSPGSSSPSGHHPSTHHGHRPGTSGQSDTTTSVPVGQTSCPTSERCILQGDVGNSAQAINTFRAQHGLTAVPTSVGPQAQSCAFHDGSGCSGSWALTYLSTPDAQEAVQKIDQYAHFEDPNIKSVQVGWAFDPGSKLYYFAVIRNG
jgi:hypothetical protein